ncbi:MAG: hypothetical protein VX197_09015, partial [Pseudomonadota bacterium]|nr:hypothetical protein [Pseudomonadota bacterium]
RLQNAPHNINSCIVPVEQTCGGDESQPFSFSGCFQRFSGWFFKFDYTHELVKDPLRMPDCQINRSYYAT